MNPDAFLQQFGKFSDAPLPWSPDDNGAQEPAEGAPVVQFKPSPFTWRDPSTIPPRQFVYGRHYIRGFLGATVAPSGIGKSMLSLGECVAMASGRNLFGIQPERPLKVWYVNLEDPHEEIERRVAATCLHHGIEPHEVEGRLFFDGRELEIILAAQTKSGAVVAVPVVDALRAALNDNGFDVLVLDPFVSAHRVTENDNNAIDVVAKTLGRLAGETHSAIECIHHTRKNGGAEITAEDGRGASALVSATRSTRVLNRMTDKEAEQAGIEPDDRRFYFRAEVDKSNLAPPAKAKWFRLASVALGNGTGRSIDDQDYVGVVTSWNWPDHFRGVSSSDLCAVQAAIAAGRWRESSQAKDWAGYAVAKAMRLDPEQKADKAKIKAMLKTWIKNGALVVVEALDEKRMTRQFIEVGTSADA